jgi:hypothetical protein
MKEKSPVSYWNLEQEWGRQRYIDQHNLNKKNGQHGLGWEHRH